MVIDVDKLDKLKSYLGVTLIGTQLLIDCD